MKPPLIQPLHIGPLAVATPFLLAPMAGFTDAAFRSLCQEQGGGAGFTEMVNAMGVTRRHARTLHLLATWAGEAPVAAHLYGSDPDVMARAAVHAQETGRFALIDINGGCPVPKIMSRGDGAGLMRDPAHFAAVVRAVKAAVTLPVTVKTRLGIDAAHANIQEVAQAVQEAGADALIVHGRFARVRHAGPADWAALGQLKHQLRIPLIGNGGIASGADAIRRLQTWGVDGVMIGRAALGNPWIFREIQCLLRGETPIPPAVPEIAAAMQTHLARLVELAAREQVGRKRVRRDAEMTACLMFRAHLVRYLRGFQRLRDLMLHLESLASMRELEERIALVLAGPRRWPPALGAVEDAQPAAALAEDVPLHD